MLYCLGDNDKEQKSVQYRFNIFFCEYVVLIHERVTPRHRKLTAYKVFSTDLGIG